MGRRLGESLRRGLAMQARGGVTARARRGVSVDEEAPALPVRHLQGEAEHGMHFIKMVVGRGDESSSDSDQDGAAIAKAKQPTQESMGNVEKTITWMVKEDVDPLDIYQEPDPDAENQDWVPVVEKAFQPKEQFQVSEEKAGIAGAFHWLKLADGRGWVKDGASATDIYAEKKDKLWVVEKTVGEDGLQVVTEPKFRALKAKVRNAKGKLIPKVLEGGQEFIVTEEVQGEAGVNFLKIQGGESWWVQDRVPQYETVATRKERTFREVFTDKVEELKDKAGSKFHIPISGNLYMFRFLKPFGESSGLIQTKSDFFVDMGLNLVMICQLIGPIFVFISATHDIEVTGFGLQNWRFIDDPGSKGWPHEAFPHFGQRLLGLVFLILFLMNGMYVINNDRKETKKLVEMSELFKREVQVHNEQVQKMLDEAAANGIEPEDDAEFWKEPRNYWLWIGAFVNCFCFFGCAASMFILFVTGEGPKDVLFDAFGLTFLYNLDDIGGDLAFLDEKWDEDLIGDMYGVLRDIPHAMDEIKKRRKEAWTPDNVYNNMKNLMWIMLVLMPLAFVFVDMKNKAAGRRLMAIPGVAGEL